MLIVSGCATLPDDLGRSDVDTMVTERGYPVDAGHAESLFASLTAQPISAEDAVRLALVNNPSLRATYAGLGLAAADVARAGRVRNPIFSGAILNSNRAGERDQLTFGLIASFTDVLTLPARSRLAAAEFAVMKQTVGARVLETATDAESAYYRYVGAQQVAALRAQIAKAGDLSSALAARYHAAGNLTRRELALERAAAAETRLAALIATADSYAMRTELATVMGVSVGSAWSATDGLPVPLAEEDALKDLLALAGRSRLDLAAAHARADVVADRLGVSGWTRWLGELDIGVERERETDGARLTGPTVEWELPVFDQHRDAWMRVDAELQIAIAEVAELSLAVDNEVHLSFAATGNAKARVRTFREQLIPARIAATSRAQEEENFMLIGIFELLAAKQEEYDAYQGYLEAVRDYWIRRAELSRAVGNSLPSSTNIGADRLDVDEIIQPQSNDHMNHDESNAESTAPPADHHAGHGNHDADGGSQ